MKQITSLVKKYPTSAFFIRTFILSWGFGALTDIIYEAPNFINLTFNLQQSLFWR